MPFPPRFTATTFSWTSNEGSQYTTGIRLYDTAIVFSQTYVTGANGTNTSSSNHAENGVSSSFPSFAAGNTPEPLGFFSYCGSMVGWYPVSGVWGVNSTVGATGASGAGPIVLFNSQLSISFVLSSASNFMAATEVRWTGERFLSQTACFTVFLFRGCAVL